MPKVREKAVSKESPSQAPLSWACGFRIETFRQSRLVPVTKEEEPQVPAASPLSPYRKTLPPLGSTPLGTKSFTQSSGEVLKIHIQEHTCQDTTTLATVHTSVGASLTGMSTPLLTSGNVLACRQPQKRPC